MYTIYSVLFAMPRSLRAQADYYHGLLGGGYSEGAPLSCSVDPLRNGVAPVPFSFLRAFASRICRRIRSDSAAMSVFTGPHLYSSIQL